MTRETVSYLSLGSNIGNKLYYLVSALHRIDLAEGVRISKISSFYETDPWGVKEQESFFNIALEIKTTLLPFELLRSLQKIESDLQRIRDMRWGPRTIDIDIIFYDHLNINTKDLILPHFRYKDRNFVLKPMYEIHPNGEPFLKYMKRDSGKTKKITPKILISSCLLGENCNYKGGNSKNELFIKLGKCVEYLSICPEIIGGLSTPRTPAERSGERIITKTGEDVTDEFFKGASKTLETAIKNRCTLAVLKGRSPSCGFEKIYDGTFSGRLIDGNGVTADFLIEEGINIVSV